MALCLLEQLVNLQHLNVNEHINAIEHTVKYVNKRIPVIAGTGANSTQEAIDLV